MRIEQVTSALVALRAEIEQLTLALETAGVGEARLVRSTLVDQIEDYLLPRLRSIDAPLLAVVGGSTGAGKSTLVNALVGAPVSAPGVRRPTTRAPVLVCSPEDVEAFAGDRVLPGLARRSGSAGPGELQLVTSATLPQGFALLDAPDIDSVVEANRELAAQLLAAADLWLFVTTAARYADAVPWELLRAARERATALAVVLDRVPPEAAEVREHLVEMLAEQGLAGTPVLVVPEVALIDGMLPEAAGAEVRSWVGHLARDASARAAVVRQTLTGALDSLDARTATLVKALQGQVEAATGLAEMVTGSFAAARIEVDQAVRGGTLLHGEVLARWQELIGTGELMRGVQAGVARVRDRVRATFTGQPPTQRKVADAVEGSVAVLVRSATERACERSTSAWAHDPAGRALLTPGLDRASAGFGEQVAREIREWQGAVVRLVGEQARTKRSMARLASYSVNGAGLVVMLAVFAHTGGLLGGEVAVAGGTSALGQVVLQAILGDQAVRSLAEQARADLLTRVEVLLLAEAARFDHALAPVTPDPSALANLRVAGAALAAARSER